MKKMSDHSKSMRVANFSKIDLAVEHLLEFDSDDIDTIVKVMRRHVDLPYAFVVSKHQEKSIPNVLSALKAIRSPCYPSALFLTDGADLGSNDSDLDVIKVNSNDPETVHGLIAEYAATQFEFNHKNLTIHNTGPLPTEVDVVIVGAGITGLYAAQRLKEAGLSHCILEKRDKSGGIWSKFANRTSQVNTSESAYRLIEKKTRCNTDHSYTREILEDIATLTNDASARLFLDAEVQKIEKTEGQYQTTLTRAGDTSVVRSKGVILAINDRVGAPREAQWDNQSAFQGKIVSGISDDAQGVDWYKKKVVVVGMGAFAIENVRTALENGARHVTVVCRRHGTICPKIIDYLNFATPYDEAFKHDKKSNIRNMMYWKKLYQQSGATQPECWMGKVKHDGHTISVSDIWFIGHHLKKIQTIAGEITRITENGIIVNNQQQVDADIIVNCIGFERNTSVAKSLSGYEETYNNNYVDKDFMYLADAYIDSDAFNSLFGSSVLEMVKFYMEVYVKFFNSPEFLSMMKTDGIETIPIDDRKWTDYIKGAMALIKKYSHISEAADNLVGQRTKNFIETHDLETYIAQNKREWIYLHSMLAGRAMTEEECLPYIFDKLLPNNA